MTTVTQFRRKGSSTACRFFFGDRFFPFLQIQNLYPHSLPLTLPIPPTPPSPLAVLSLSPNNLAPPPQSPLPPSTFPRHTMPASASTRPPVGVHRNQCVANQALMEEETPCSWREAVDTAPGIHIGKASIPESYCWDYYCC